MQILNLFFGIALFLFGMNLMSDHLKKIAGGKSEILLYKLTNKPLRGVLVGTAVTALIQSSSAVCAMVVGFAENSLISLKRAIAIILGSIFGTGITGWLIAYSSFEFGNTFAKLFSASVLSAVCAIAGIVLKLFIKNTKLKRIGEILLGFAVLMLGISTITAAVAPLKENPVFLKSFVSVQNPLLLVLIGTVFAALLQSASAAVGILQTLSLTGLISLHACAALLFGIGIGASLPVLLVSVGKNTTAKQTALSYLLADAIGAGIFSVLFYGIIAISELNTTQIIMSPLSIAIANTAYRFMLVLLMFPFIPHLEKLCKRLVKCKNTDIMFQKEVNRGAN
ncbi:MAG: Na/Pi cotransporter family protein [Clostridia bacterium]|nr:Na/Pi cotransporter family protein [Clostridia bacterium]